MLNYEFAISPLKNIKTFQISKEVVKDECYLIGKITKTHGLKGELSLLLDVDYPEEYEEMESVFIEVKGELLPYFIEEIQLRENKQIIKFEGIDKIDDAKNLVGKALYLPLDSLPELEDDESYYFHEIINFQVIDEKSGQLGKVDSVYQYPQQDIISMNFQGKEVMIPINDEIVKKVNRETKEVFVNLPDGLLDVYLSE